MTDNITAHPDKNKLSPREQAFKKLQEGKKNALNDKIKKKVEEVLAAKALYEGHINALVELEEEYTDVDKEKLDL